MVFLICRPMLKSAIFHCTGVYTWSLPQVSGGAPEADEGVLPRVRGQVHRQIRRPRHHGPRLPIYLLCELSLVFINLFPTQ